jgi:hypothetical protein
MATNRNYGGVSREEEMRLIAAHAEKIKKDRAYALRLMQEAGILDKDGQITDYYKPKAE